MSDLMEAFEERLKEIETYLDLLKALDKELQEGRAPRIGTDTTITTQQQRILYSSVYLQLYNLVESTITRCLEALSFAAVEKKRWLPHDLSDNLRREWVRSISSSDIDLTYDHRLEAALKLCEHLVQALPISSDFKITMGEGGNWDDVAIYRISVRLGLSLSLSSDVESKIKMKFRDDQSPLVFIKNLRNKLAHGNLSFVECGDGITFQDLQELKERTALYLREVVISFKTFIDAYGFLLPSRRPQDAGNTP